MTKKTPSKIFRELEALCSPLTSRPEYQEPFETVIWGRNWIAATDEHRVHGVQPFTTRKLGLQACPGGAMDGDKLELVATIDWDLLRALRQFPKSWTTILYLGPEGTRFEVWTGRGERTVNVFPHMDPGPYFFFPVMPGKRVVINGRYLVEACRWIRDESETASVYQEQTQDGWAPYVFLPHGTKPYTANRFAAVAPVRS